MALIIREKVANECTSLARKIETIVREDPNHVLDDQELEKLCEDSIQNIIDNANVQIERAIEETEYQYQDNVSFKRTREMYDERRAEITDVVNIRLSTREKPDEVREDQTNTCYNEFEKRVGSILDPNDIIKVKRSSPALNVDKINETDLLCNPPSNPCWGMYQSMIELEVDEPYEQFFNCSYDIIDLLKKNCKTGQDVEKILNVLAAHSDYTKVINIRLLHELASFMLSLITKTDAIEVVKSCEENSSQDSEEGESTISEEDDKEDEQNTEELLDEVIRLSSEVMMPCKRRRI